MRKIALIVIGAIVLLAGWNYFTTGRVSLLPGGESALEGKIRGLEHDLDSARATYRQAGAGAGIAGMDTTGDVETARQQLTEVERGIRSLRDAGGLQPAETERLNRLEGSASALRREIGT